MRPGAAYRQFIEDQLSSFGPVSIRPMFGGAGVFRDGMMFALIADDVLYLKADPDTRGEFEALGLKPFEYLAKGKPKVIMGYWRCPEACFDDQAEMALWANKAFGAALRARDRKAKPGRRPPHKN
jgi:DNA transformation protein